MGMFAAAMGGAFTGAAKGTQPLVDHYSDLERDKVSDAREDLRWEVRQKRLAELKGEERSADEDFKREQMVTEGSSYDIAAKAEIEKEKRKLAGDKELAELRKTAKNNWKTVKKPSTSLVDGGEVLVDPVNGQVYDPFATTGDTGDTGITRSDALKQAKKEASSKAGIFSLDSTDFPSTEGNRERWIWDRAEEIMQGNTSKPQDSPSSLLTTEQKSTLPQITKQEDLKTLSKGDLYIDPMGTVRKFSGR